MSTGLEHLASELSDLEQQETIEESEVAAKLRAANAGASDPCAERRFEILAFTFAEGNGSGDSPFYGTQAAWRNDEGEIVELPSVNDVTPECINYWTRRSEDTQHPVLRARYSGLVWQLSNAVLAHKAKHAIARTWISSILEIAARNMSSHPIPMLKKLEAAFRLSVALNDKAVIEVVKNTLLWFESNEGDDNSPGLWGVSFELLVQSKRGVFSDAEEASLIANLESRLDRLQWVDPWSCEHAAVKLASYYRDQNKLLDARRVIGVLGASFRRFSANASPLQAGSWLDRLCGIYREFGMAAEVEQTMKEIRKRGSERRESLTEHVISIDIKREEIERFVEPYIRSDVESFYKAVVGQFMFKKDKIEGDLAKMAGHAPLTSIFAIDIVDEDGVKLATVGSLTDDLQGRIVHHIGDRITFEAPYLRHVIAAGVDHYALTAKDVFDFLKKSPAFADKQDAVLLKSIEFYFSGELTAAIHLMVTQIEAAFRTLVELTGGSILKMRNNNSGFDYRTLDDLIRSPGWTSVFDENAKLYLRVLLTDRRGGNVRNLVCHGLQPNIFGWHVADRLLHVMLLFAHARKIAA